MRTSNFLTRTTVALAAVVFAITLAGAAIAASGFVGKWKVTDTKGEPFTIWLSDDGTAKGDRSGEGLSGNWKEEGDTAIITWESGWMTKIAKDGDSYQKTAIENGKQVGDPSKAEKVE